MRNGVVERVNPADLVVGDILVMQVRLEITEIASYILLKVH